jgi:hypothetical protein
VDKLPPQNFVFKTLLPLRHGILGGASKIGKSWLVLDLCVRVAKGEPFWNLPTTKGTTLYLCLEDTFQRVQERLLRITDEWPSNAYFAVAAKTLADGLGDQIRDFVKEHSDTVLVVIDVFQMIRGNEKENSYATDYRDIQTLKQISGELTSQFWSFLNRKLEDEDPINMLSGTTGISGAGTAPLSERSKRNQTNAKLSLYRSRDMKAGSRIEFKQG